MDLLSGLRKGDSSRGGRADFKWEDVKEDKDRENYLGHSLMAPVGRWQKGKDLTWYAKTNNEDLNAAENARREEIRRIKEAEQDALSEALGFKVVRRHQDPVSDADVRKAIREAGGAGGGDDEEEQEEGRGVGFGKTGGIKGLLRQEEGSRVTTDDVVQADASFRPVQKDNRKKEKERRDRDRHRSRRHHGRSRSRSRDGHRDGGKDRERRHHRRSSRSRSRRRDRDDEGERRKYKSRDHERRYNDARRGRNRSQSPRRDYDRRR